MAFRTRNDREGQGDHPDLLRQRPNLSYWNGCSTGGRQGLKEAQKFPDDYDGIIAGAPANRTAISLWIAAAVLKDPASYIPPATYSAIHNAVLRQRDALDGVKDGVLENPTQCKFDPKVLLCKEGDAPSCLTAPQVEAARRLYEGPRNVFPGLEPGSELGWSMLSGPKPMSLAAELYQYLVFKNPNWDYKTFDAAHDVRLAEKQVGETLDATNVNLKPFVDHGGKLLMYHGWSDPGIPPLATVQYYKNVDDTPGGTAKTTNSIRLFMIPGMNHCRGGDGTDIFDGIAALDAWVEEGKTPDRIEASHLTGGKVDRTRPLCPYPQVAVYKGAGSTDDAANFVCR